MWILEAISVPNEAAEGSFILPVGNYEIGRNESESNILCLHASISRKHAQISIRREESCKDWASTEACIQDSSRYGTIVNDEKLGKAGSRVLKPGQGIYKIQFGFKHVFRLIQRSVRLCKAGTSTGIDEIEKCCHELGFALTECWDYECTHVLSDAKADITSAPILLSQLKGVPIVTSKWLAAWISREGLQAPQPLESEFRPVLISPDGQRINQEQLDHLQASRLGRRFHNMKFFIDGKVKDSGVLRQVLELCGALIADRDQAEIIVVGSNDDVLSGCTQGTTPSRIISCLLQNDVSGLLVSHKVPAKRSREDVQPIEEEATAQKKLKKGCRDHQDQSDETDAGEEENGEELNSQEGKDITTEATQHKTIEGPLEGIAALTYTVQIMRGTPKPSGTDPSYGHRSNFKAFRRKGKQQALGISPKILQMVKVGSAVPTVDVNAFLNSERTKREQAEAAEELFSSKVPTKKIITAKRGK